MQQQPVDNTIQGKVISILSEAMGIINASQLTMAGQHVGATSLRIEQLGAVINGMQKGDLVIYEVTPAVVPTTTLDQLHDEVEELITDEA